MIYCCFEYLDIGYHGNSQSNQINYENRPNERLKRDLLLQEPLKVAFIAQIVIIIKWLWVCKGFFFSGVKLSLRVYLLSSNTRDLLKFSPRLLSAVLKLLEVVRSRRQFRHELPCHLCSDVSSPFPFAPQAGS